MAAKAASARHVHEARRAADQRAAGKGEPRNCLPSALGERAGAIGDALAAFQMLADQRMRLGALKFLEGIEIGVGIVKMHDEADRHQALAEMIEERAAAGLVVEGPAHRVLDEARPVLVGGNLPQLFQPDAEFLRARLGIEPELPDELLSKRAARPFGDQRVLAAERDARRIAVLVAAVASHTLVAGDHALDRAILAEDCLGHGDAGIDLDACLLGLLAEPAAEAAQAADIAAVIAHERRHEDVGNADAARLPEIVEAVLCDLGLERRALLAPIGDQLVEAHGIDHRAGENMGADL
jgi:hypothetical protein